ncbi:MFS transporter [Streptoalloteichus hindustanus]|uniref:Predicted arabinose efflux permease, MFS family n=1 Tax=Streptoalloteichus hindustanus TaxID=2017 RepID=A0A1M5PQ63_STRHI|nr:MFS transporter [Streptoalloteichus hindustanus]SHH03806.1 Predicted arabinose efflux permease, MFS family [Streptoalloteichus hindustanus]
MKRSAQVVVTGTVFVDLLGFGIILPQLPYYAERLGASGTWVGLLLTAYSAAQLVSTPVLGALSDRYGRRPLLLLSLFGSTVSLALAGLADTLPLLLLTRLLAGLFGGSISVAQAYVADVVPEEGRTRALGLLGAAIGMGFVLGPALGAALAPFGFATATFAAAALAAANLVLAWFRLVEPARTEERRPERRPGVLAGLRAALGVTGASPVMAAMFLSMFAFASMEAVFALLGERRFGLGGSGLGLVFAAVGVVTAVVQGGLVGRLARRWGDRSVAVAGALLMAGSLAALPWAPAPAAYVALGLLAAGQGLITPTLTSVLSGLTAQRGRGSLLGIGQSVSAAARGVGPLCAGVLFDVGAGTPFYLAAVLAAVAAVTLLAFAGGQDDHNRPQWTEETRRHG